MRTLEQILADANEKRPFSNGTSGEIWMDQWCYRCKVDGPFQRDETMDGCPLLAVALLGHTPKEWTETGLQDYHCCEFVPDDEDGDEDDPEPEPVPQPVGELDGQTDMFSVFADQITDAVTEREAVSANAS